MRRLRHAFAFVFPLLLAACAGRQPAPATPEASASTDAAAPGLERTAFAPSLDVNLRRMTRTPTGLYYRDLQVGTGAELAQGQYVAIHYTGWLTDGTKFDDNQPGQRPLSFRYGVGQVVPGFDQGLAGMRVGGKRQIVIPSSLGYGDQQVGPIPPSSTLVFVFELVAAQ